MIRICPNLIKLSKKIILDIGVFMIYSGFLRSEISTVVKTHVRGISILILINLTVVFGLIKKIPQTTILGHKNPDIQTANQIHT
jgi:hypothetical protein